MKVSILDALLKSCDLGALVDDVRIGQHWTAVAVRISGRRQAGLASSTSGPPDHPHGQPPVRDSGRLLEHSVGDLVAMIRSPSVAEASVGLATINALLKVDEKACVEIYAGDTLVQKGADRLAAGAGVTGTTRRACPAGRALARCRCGVRRRPTRRLSRSRKRMR